MTAFEDRLAAIDARFERCREEAKLPGAAWGVIRDGRLVHTGGVGTIRDGEDARPDADSVFRIASMTKSFTAAAILVLRDDGRLRLDDPVADHVPALASWRPPTADSGPITIRDLLTMSAGLATDDPWGDRQQGLPLDAFAELLSAGPSFAWPPGVMFEYSNLGYGILGRVVTNASGREYREFVRDRILAPLGMNATGYLEEEVPPERLAHGYVRRDDEIVREGRDPYGALASMGGIFTSVRDLSIWVAGFLDAFPARDDPDTGHPLRRAARREMQQVHRLIPPTIPAHPAHAASTAEVGGYGYGLFVRADPELGTFVTHGGGYPGFGTHMAWHPASGLGLVGFSNLRYGKIHPVVAEQLAELVRADVVPARRTRANAETEALRPLVDGLLAAWDDAVADGAFAMNMDLDEPRDRRRAAVEQLVAELGPFQPDDGRPVESDTPAHLAWWLRGPGGRVRLAILVSPEPRPRLQLLSITAVPDPSPRLQAAAEAVVAAANDDSPAWPADLETGPDLDTAVVERSMRAAAARFGRLRLDQPRAGDGRTTTTFDATGSDGRAEVTITVDPGTGVVTGCVIAAPERMAPAEGW
jgi:serine-type D-Ala-D-Ala carboxypeptidase/endopeptidase